MTPKENVLQLRSSAGVFGAENVILELAKGLKATSFRSSIGVLRNGSTNWRELSVAAAKNDIDTVEFDCRRPLDASAILAIRRFVSEKQIGIIHAHGYKANLYASAATRGLPITRIATCHPWTEVAYSFKARLYTRLDKALLSGFDSLVAVSESVKEELLTAKLPAEKISLIPNGIDLSRFTATEDRRAVRSQLGLPLDKVIVGAIGRLVPEKALSLLIEAARSLRSEFPQVSYVIVGDGPLRGQLEREASAAGLQEQIVFLGTIDRIPEALAAIDIFVLPSISEGLPMVVLEAMASRKPVVASRVGAIPSVVAHGESGLLIEPQSADLASAISRLLKDPVEAGRFGQNACARVTRDFSSKAMTEGYTQIYRQTTHAR